MRRISDLFLAGVFLSGVFSLVYSFVLTVANEVAVASPDGMPFDDTAIWVIAGMSLMLFPLALKYFYFVFKKTK